MRQRKAKDLETRLAACTDFIYKTQGDKPLLSKVFSGHRELCVEVGSGKGQFIIKRAALNPDVDYMGIEGQETVVLRAAEKARAVSGKMEWPENVPGEERLEGLSSPLENLKFVNCFVENMPELFHENQLAGVYLNFSDPWPKARHAKRRLTYHRRLLDYAWAIRDGGFIEIKTDNEGLFASTLEEIEICQGMAKEKDGVPFLEMVEMTRDLHCIGEEDGGEKYEAAEITTEYEDKFSGRGKNINYVKLIVNK